MNRQGPEESQPAAEPIISAPLGRRSVLKGMGAGAVTVGGGGLLAACGSGIKGSGAQSSSGTINVGFVTPLTGPLAGFASGDQFVLSEVRKTIHENDQFLQLLMDDSTDVEEDSDSSEEEAERGEDYEEL